MRIAYSAYERIDDYTKTYNKYLYSYVIIFCRIYMHLNPG